MSECTATLTRFKRPKSLAGKTTKAPLSFLRQRCQQPIRNHGSWIDRMPSGPWACSAGSCNALQRSQPACHIQHLAGTFTLQLSTGTCCVLTAHQMERIRACIHAGTCDSGINDLYSSVMHVSPPQCRRKPLTVTTCVRTHLNMPTIKVLGQWIRDHGLL